MPRISAPTLAEHRAAQRDALVHAAERLLIDGGIAAVTPRRVCEQAGLSRSSFYDYFPSKDDLLVAIAISAIERWDREIEQALTDVEPGLDELKTLVDATMAMTADGKHRIAGALRDADLSPQHYDELMILHDALVRPVIRVLQHLGAPDPGSSAVLVQGVLGAGIQLVSHGRNPEDVASDVFRLLRNGIIEQP